MYCSLLEKLGSNFFKGEAISGDIHLKFVLVRHNNVSLTSIVLANANAIINPHEKGKGTRVLLLV